MRYANIAVVALPALLALAMLQPGPEPKPAPQPSAAQIDAAIRYAQSQAGLDRAGLHRH